MTRAEVIVRPCGVYSRVVPRTQMSDMWILRVAVCRGKECLTRMRFARTGNSARGRLSVVCLVRQASRLAATEIALFLSATEAVSTGAAGVGGEQVRPNLPR